MPEIEPQLGSRKWQDILVEGATRLSIDVSRDQAERYARFAQELVHWNRKINLTAIHDSRDIAVKHIIDSLAPAAEIEEGSRLIDIGAGGGFPGIPLKILLPSLSLTMIDGSRKKVNFLKHIIRVLKLEGIEARHVRAEALAGEEGQGGGYDAAICRALGGLDQFVELALPLIRQDGKMIAMKGARNTMEMDALRSSTFYLPDGGILTGFHLDVDTKEYNLPVLGDRRTLYIIRVRGAIHP